MSNYTQSTNFATKDSLPSGDPLKIVKGTEINTEFNNISVAIATKADTTSPTFTGLPLAPTASPSTNNTQLATTAYADAAVLAVRQTLYPIGSIYINAGVTTNPATLLGFGTWAAFGAGRVMIGLDGGDTLFDALEETGGSKDATLVSHTHTANGVENHEHFVASTAVTSANSSGTTVTPSNFVSASQGASGLNESYNLTGTNVPATIGRTSGAGSHTHTIDPTGSSATNANLQPYITVAMWKRTA